VATPPLPAAYVERMTSLLGDEAADFFASYDRPARPGLRVNPYKIAPEEFQQRSPWPLEPVPWCSNGFYLPEDAPAGKHPWHAAGVYYLQEPSAMAVVGQMILGDETWVADLCASPGGKSTQIEEKLGTESLLVANEVVGSRIKALGENLERWGTSQSVITNLEIHRIADLLPSGFDEALLDAPCSGEGLFRRTPDARAEWSPAHVEGSARRQRALLEQAARLVSPGGDLVYSTCTFAPEENEQVVAAFLDAHPAWDLDPIDDDRFAPGRSDWAETGHDLSGMARLWPHQLEGDGHTIAILHRGDNDYDTDIPFDAPAQIPNAPEFAQEMFGDFAQRVIPGFSIDSYLIKQGEALMLLPLMGQVASTLPMVRKGLWAGTYAPDRFTPSHALALYLQPSQCSNVEALDFEQAAHYLAGEVITRPGTPGWVLMTFDGFPLGWGKRSGDAIKNHYPKGLRRPVASWKSAAG
jgi:16S rRNA C967 or C1407 C5-methylase (RsmB/RsmF family)/NOL1/NOP2/fmu family ribosome biogenesis protein